MEKISTILKSIKPLSGMMLIITYFWSCEQTNNPPILEVTVESRTPLPRSTQTLEAFATDIDGDEVYVSWASSGGFLNMTTGLSVTWTAPDSVKEIIITTTAKDDKNGETTFETTLSVENVAPAVVLSVPNPTPLPSSTQTLEAIITDTAGDEITVSWSTSDGTLSDSTGFTVEWTAPDSVKEVIITTTAKDDMGGETVIETTILVENSQPIIIEYTSNADYILYGHSVSLICIATESDGEELMYNFSSPEDAGIFVTNSNSNTAQWTAPAGLTGATEYDLIVEVSDPHGAIAADTITLLAYSDYGSVWVLDSGNNILKKYSENGKYILTANQTLLNPVAIANDVFEFFGCWVSDYDAGKIYKINSLGETDFVYSNLNQIIDIEKHHDSNIICAISVQNSTLNLIDGFSNTVLKEIHGFQRPTSITINQSNGDVWITEPDLNRIVKVNIYTPPDTVNTSNSDILSDSLNTPTSIAISTNSSGSNILFIADKNDNEIEVIEYNSLLDTSFSRITQITGPDFSKPFLLKRGLEKVWVISQNGMVNSINESDYSIEGSILLTLPGSISVDETDGYFWVGDNGTNQLIKFGSDGNEELTMGNFSFIKDIVINK